MSGKKRKAAKGILGFPKKKSILFTFNAREGEECSTDSEDSDYSPGSLVPTRNAKKAKRKGNNQARQGLSVINRRVTRKETVALEANACCKNEIIHMCLPSETMLNIFSFCLASEGLLKFLSRVPRVCKEWNRLAKDQSLFKQVNLSSTLGAMNKKRLKGLLKLDLSHCRVLNFEGQMRVKQNFLEPILTKTHRLVSLNLCHCPGATSAMLSKLPVLCPNLGRIKLSQTFDYQDKIVYTSIVPLIVMCGQTILEIRWSNVIFVKTEFTHFIDMLKQNCPNLEELDIKMANCACAYLPSREADIGGFISACPKLKELRLDSLNVLDIARTSVPYPGLNNLEIFAQTKFTHDVHEKPIFYLMFGSVAKLKVLDISYSNLSPGLITDKVKALECLHMVDMRWSEEENINLYQCINSWMMSLKELDISCNKMPSKVITEALSQYRKGKDARTSYPLEVLNLSNTQVYGPLVQLILEECSNLKSINLNTCRNLPRGCKQLFFRKSFPDLLARLQQVPGP
ncbi:unnamed protein product [Lymnaea stagnalis]|uniref:F-box domain-containing protein n=1 Tax=Lymnaea stagnalis TaxID=6523 RepID=A0AAV2ID02_LYMST